VCVSNRGWSCMMPDITAESLQRAANDDQTLTGHVNCPIGAVKFRLS